MLATLKHLILDTFRQAFASGISWMMFAVTGICVALCLSAQVSGDVALYAKDEPGFFLPPSAKIDPQKAKQEGIETISGRLTLAFGAIIIPLDRERSDLVRFLELILGGAVAGTFGLLLALVWTAGFAPTFLEPSAAAVLLAKPVPRWQLLLGKYLGVLAFVGFQVVLFVSLTWLALGVRTDVWEMTYWWSIPLLLLQFAIFYSFSVLMAVVTHSTVACVFGAVLFWLLGWGINYGFVMARSLAEANALPPLTLTLADAAYWISPKPIDLSLILWNTLDIQQHFAKPPVFQILEKSGTFSPELSVLSSLAITALLLILSFHEFNGTDY